MALKKLIIVRHGEYEGSFLTENGRAHVGALAEKLAEAIGGAPVVILSSPAGRAMRTAWVLEEKLKDAFFEREHQYQFLESKGGELTPTQASATVDVIEEMGASNEIVLLSTHLEFVEKFPSFWGVTRGLKIPFAYSMPYASARIVDVATGKVENILA